jgi:DHA1 family tetracycline resistance protein-like MFS transporter
MHNASDERPRSIFPLLWVMLFDHTSLNITFPVLTLLFFDMQSSLFAADTSHAVRSMWYGFCVAIPHVVNIIMTPILSGLSDEFGRKKLLFVGTVGAFLFAMTAGFGILWGSLTFLFLGRIIQGAFSRTQPIAQAVIGDISSYEHKVRDMGYLQLSISIGAFFGPIIGGYFAHQILFKQLNFSLPYFIAALFAGISIILTVVMFKETLAVKKNATWNIINWRSFHKVISNRDVLFISAILFLSQISWSLYYQLIPPILKTTFGFEAHALGLFVGLIAFWLALATGVGIQLLRRFCSLERMLFISLYLVLIGLVVSIVLSILPLHTPVVILVWLAAIPIAVGDVIAYSCLITLYSNVVDKKEQGKVMGVCFTIVAIIWSLTALLGGLMMSYVELLPLFVAPLGVFIAILLLHSKIVKLPNRI